MPLLGSPLAVWHQVANPRPRIEAKRKPRDPRSCSAMDRMGRCHLNLRLDQWQWQARRVRPD